MSDLIIVLGFDLALVLIFAVLVALRLARVSFSNPRPRSTGKAGEHSG